MMSLACVLGVVAGVVVAVVFRRSEPLAYLVFPAAGGLAGYTVISWRQGRMKVQKILAAYEEDLRRHKQESASDRP